MSAPDDRAVAEEQSRRQRDRAVEIIAEAMEEYDLPYERMIVQPTAGEVAADLWETWAPHQRSEPLIECNYSLLWMFADVMTALRAQGDKTANLSAIHERIGEHLVKSVRKYIFGTHAHLDADEAAQRLAQRRREYQRELAQRRAYE